MLVVCVASPMGGAASVVDCPTVIGEYLGWAGSGQGFEEGSHAVGAKMAALKIREMNPETYPWGHGSYSEGRLGWHGNEMTGRFTVLFSDRKSSDGKYRFNPDAADLQDITVFADGRVQVILRTWGDATFLLEDVTCYADGFLTGVKREANGVSLVVLLLRKEVMLLGRDGFRDWPSSPSGGGGAAPRGSLVRDVTAAGDLVVAEGQGSAATGRCTIAGRAVGPRSAVARVFSVSIFGPDDASRWREDVPFDPAGNFRSSALPDGSYRLLLDTKADVAVNVAPNQPTVSCTDGSAPELAIEFR